MRDKRYRKPPPGSLGLFIKMANVEVEKRTLIRGCALLEGVRPAGFDAAPSFDALLESIKTSLAHWKTRGRTEKKREAHFRAEQAAAARRLEGTVVYVPGDPASTLLAFHRARHIRATLLGIARAARLPDKSAHIEIALPRLSSYHVAQVGSDNMVSVKLAKTWDARQYSEFIETLSGLDAGRIRECLCGRIYWAPRSDKRVCSANCRLARWRKEKPGKAADIQNRYEERHPNRKRKATRRKNSETPTAPDRPYTGSRRAPRPPGWRQHSRRG